MQNEISTKTLMFVLTGCVVTLLRTAKGFRAWDANRVFETPALGIAYEFKR